MPLHLLHPPRLRGAGTKDKWATVAAVGLSVGLLGGYLAPQSASAATPASGPLISLGKCADDAAFATADGSPVVLWDCNGGTNQKWTFPGDGTVRVLGKCLTVTGATASSPDGTTVELRTCDTGSDAQTWKSANGALVHALTGKCLDVPGSRTANGTRLVVWACGDRQANQSWAQPAGSAQDLTYRPFAADDPGALQASPGSGWRQEIFFNAKDLTNPFTVSNPQPTDSSGKVDLEATLAANAAEYGGSTRVTQLYFYLWDYAKTDIPASAIANMQGVLDKLRARGYKVVLRFTIDDGLRPDQCYTVQDIQRLTTQVKPLVAANADMIQQMQAGFVGDWGEWGPNCYDHQKYPAAVNTILTTQVQSLPAGMPFTVRYSWLREQVTDPALRARIGYHNDYFTAGGSCCDYYTPGSADWNKITAAAQTVTVDGEMPYDKNESKDPYAWSTPIDALASLKRLQTMHYSTLSVMHNHTVTLPAWRQTRFTRDQLSSAGLPAEDGYFTNTDGSAATRTAFDYLRDHLGYRLRLTSATIGTTNPTGTSLPVSLKLVNDGFAAPRGNASVHLVLLDSAGRTVRDTTVAADWRTWQGLAGSETTTGATQPRWSVNAGLDLAGLPSGAYRVGLRIATGKTDASNGAAYDVRTANRDTAWVKDADSGVNVIGTVSL